MGLAAPTSKLAPEIAPGRAPLRVTVLRSPSELDALERDYAALYQAMPVVLPFQHQAWHAHWWRTFASNDWFMRDRLRVHVVRADDGRCVAIAPLFVTERPAIGPLRVRLLQALGADPAFTEIRSILFDPAFEEQAARALLGHVREEGGWDIAAWSDVAEGSPFARVLAEEGGTARGADKAHYVLDLPKSFEELRRGLKRNIRESIRHGYNSLKRDGHKFRFDVAETAREVDAALPTFFGLHCKRAGALGSVHHVDRFALRGGRAFLRDVAVSLAESGVTKVFTLSIGGVAVASRIGFVLGKQLYLYYSGFDPRWWQYGVMTTALTEVIRFAIDRGLGSVDLSTGNDVSKTRWGPRPVAIHDVLQIDPSLRGRLAARAMEVAARLRAQPGTLRRLLPIRRWE